MTWLVTGGAGYIGAHVVRALRGVGIEPLVYDDLSTGSLNLVPEEVRFVRGSVLDLERVAAVISGFRIRGVIHLAAKKAPAESIADPLLYYRENVTGLINVLDAMQVAHVERLVFSSSAAVYGATSSARVDEAAACRPENPYGQTKLVGEWLVDAAAKSSDLRFVTLRYFNVAGAASPTLRDRGHANLIPRVLSAIQEGGRPEVFGQDYPTPDGTCVRDFVHVADLAHAHALAAVQLEINPLRSVFNVGTGRGASVLEIMSTVASVTGIGFEYDVVDRRPGDPASVVGDVSKIYRDLGWLARRDLRSMVASAWVTPTPLADRTDQPRLVDANRSLDRPSR